MRVLGIDLGTRRVGVALSDPSGTLASPYEVVHRGRDIESNRRRLVAIAVEVGAERVVVGMPLSMDGSAGPAARAAAEEAAALADLMPVPVETFDERLTTVSAERSMVALRMKTEAQRRVVDKVAAAVMLQAWLDGRARER